jgi:acetyl esterase/lipase
MKCGSSLRLFGLACSLLFLVACVPSTTPSQPASTAISPTVAPPAPAPTLVPTAVQDYEILRDIAYQTDGSDYAQERGKLDIYLPKNRRDFPVLVWFHGGALMYEDKNESYAIRVAKRLASEGIGVVVPNYRLFPNAKYPAYIEDAASAAAWVVQNIGSYQGNPQQVFVGGHSSGAYLAAMAVLDERYLKQHQLSSKQIAGAILLSGEMFGDSTVWAERGLPKTDAVDETTPMFHVRRDVPPVLSLCAEYAENPPTVCEENQKFVEALRESGHDNVAFEKIPGRTHFTISDMTAPDDPVVKLILTFIGKAISGK